jgi:hypothetical protein
MVLDKTKNRQNVMLQETGRVKTLEFAAKVAETEEAAGACHGLPMKRGIAKSSSDFEAAAGWGSIFIDTCLKAKQSASSIIWFERHLDKAARRAFSLLFLQLRSHLHKAHSSAMPPFLDNGKDRCTSELATLRNISQHFARARGL